MTLKSRRRKKSCFISLVIVSPRIHLIQINGRLSKIQWCEWTWKCHDHINAVSVAVKQRKFFYLRIRDFKITPQKVYLVQRFAQINGRTTKICLSFIYASGLRHGQSWKYHYWGLYLPVSFTYQWNKARFLPSSWLQSHFAESHCSLIFLSISRINVGKISLTIFVHDFAISSIVESSLLTSLSNHDGRMMPSNHVQQNPGLHTTLKPAVNHKKHT